jgi:hypothetical protein
MKVEQMKYHSDAISWALVLTAATSFVSMICLYQIDHIVHGTLYNYGLQFSYEWAVPYWRLAQITFAMSWINIIVALAVQVNKLKIKRKAEQPATAIERAKETARTPETMEPAKESAKEAKGTERKAVEPTEAPGEKPIVAPEPEAQEEKEAPQKPEETPEQEPHLPESKPEPESKPDEIPCLADLFQAIS